MVFIELDNLKLYFFCNRFSNTTIPDPMKQKKQCNPAITKSFKERNPDLDIDEIQNNPNIPDDVKAAISGAVTDVAEDEELESNEMPDTSIEELIMEKYDDPFLDESDEELKNVRRGRKSNDDDDDEWFATKKQRMEKIRLSGPKKSRGRPKRKSDEGNAGSSEKIEKVRKRPTKKKSDDDAKSSKNPADPQKIVKKLPPVLPSPFSLLDLSTKKFEGKIPIKKESNDMPQSIASMLSAGPGKHERKQDKNSIWRNNCVPPAVPVYKSFAKPAITYPNPSNLLRNGGVSGDNATLSSILDDSAAALKPSNYCPIHS